MPLNVSQYDAVIPDFNFGHFNIVSRTALEFAGLHTASITDIDKFRTNASHAPFLPTDRTARPDHRRFQAGSYYGFCNDGGKGEDR